MKRLNKAMLWVATIVVLTFAFFPNYVGALLSGDNDPAQNSSAAQTIVLDIDGMTCTGCAVTVEKALGKVAGVGNATVNYEDARAVVRVDSVSAASTKALVEAVEKAGYKASIDDGK